MAASASEPSIPASASSSSLSRWWRFSAWTHSAPSRARAPARRHEPEISIFRKRLHFYVRADQQRRKSMSTRNVILVGGLLGALAAATYPGPFVSTFTVTSAEAAMSSKLGDLSSFRAIVTDTAALVDKDDLPGAKTRIKDLEPSWDEAEKAIDRALTALRASAPDAANCKQSLSDLLAVMDGA